mmetsp:Transcript_63324/g.151321  ORF Transcript_63324/g.151321 Transcript_63324/m.151321 type:complete len:380 (+) Transcript_63324:73-1212(+)
MTPCVPAMGPMLAVQAMQMGQPAAQMNVVAMMPGQCIVAMRVPTETVKDSGFRPMPSTPSTGTPPSTSDEEAEELDNRQRRKPATKPRSWQPGPVAAGLVCNPAADFFAQHSQERLQRQLQGDRQEVTKALGALKGHVWDLSCHQAGCRLVQLALENAKQRQASELGSELKGHVQEAMASPHANYVVQKILTQLLWNSCSFVAEEFQGSAAALSQHRFGCRAFCRLLEFHAQQEGTLLLVDEILQESVELCCHPFGHHVVQSILEHGLVEHRDRVALAIAANDTLGLATDQNASYLVEKAVCSSSPRYQEALLKELRPFLAHLAMSRFGCYVARALVDHPMTHRASALQEIRSCQQELRKTKHGLLLLLDLGLMQRKSK